MMQVPDVAGTGTMLGIAVAAILLGVLLFILAAVLWFLWPSIRGASDV